MFAGAFSACPAVGRIAWTPGSDAPGGVWERCERHVNGSLSMRSQRDGRGRYQKWDGASALRAEDGDLENGARDIDASIPSTETPGDFPESSSPPPPRRWLLWGKRIGRAALWLGAFTGLIALFVLALFRLFPPAASPVSEEPGAKRVLLVSLDGFRADYLDRQERPPTAGVRRASVSRTAADSTYLAPNLRQLAARGFRAAYLEPVFPTKTFPNHQSIITGQYPESHGVVDNVFYDPVLNETFNMGHLEERFWGGEPLWATLRRQGRVTAAYDWPGSEVTYRQTWKRPHAHAGPFNASRPYAERVRQIIEWYERGVVDDQGKLQVPDLVAVYLEPVDHAGHSGVGHAGVGGAPGAGVPCGPPARHRSERPRHGRGGRPATRRPECDTIPSARIPRRHPVAVGHAVADRRGSGDRADTCRRRRAISADGPGGQRCRRPCARLHPGLDGGAMASERQSPGSPGIRPGQHRLALGVRRGCRGGQSTAAARLGRPRLRQHRAEDARPVCRRRPDVPAQCRRRARPATGAAQRGRVRDRVHAAGRPTGTEQRLPRCRRPSAAIGMNGT
eukprot:ctg_227.g133